MAKKGVCWMCGRPGPLTEEHVFPDWVRRIFAADGNEIFLSDHRAGMVERSRTWTNQSGEVTVTGQTRADQCGVLQEAPEELTDDFPKTRLAHRPARSLRANGRGSFSAASSVVNFVLRVRKSSLREPIVRRSVQ